MSLIHRGPLTPLELAARRRNAQKSTGPRTPQGKFRSSLNALKRDPLSPVLSEMIRFRGENLKEYRKMHFQLIALFLPQNLDQSECVTHLAEAWWQKVRAMRAPEGEGFRRDHIREANERIERGLASLIEYLRRDTRKWRYLLRACLGGEFNSLAELRIQVETHLEVVSQAADQLALQMFMMGDREKRSPYIGKGLDRVPS
jgi:hypothetical protein